MSHWKPPFHVEPATTIAPLGSTATAVASSRLDAIGVRTLPPLPKPGSSAPAKQGVAVTVTVGVGVAVGVSVGVSVGVVVATGVSVGNGVAVGCGVSVGVAVGVSVA